MAVRFYEFLNQNSNLINIVESKYLTIIMLIVVVSNTFILIFETYDLHYHRHNSFFLITEKIFLCIYIIECLLKLWAYSWRYFKTLWNCFDLFIIIVGIIDLITQELIYDSVQTSLQIDYNQQTQVQYERINHILTFLRVLRVLRSFRALRVLRTIRFIQPIHTIVQTCSKALPAMASITFIMIIITCISAIIARSLFGDICPEKFNNLVKTFFSLFTLLTLDDWYSVYQVCEERDYAIDSFQHTLDYDTQLKEEDNIEERILKNLTQLTEEYCIEKQDKKHIDEYEKMNLVKGGQRKKNLVEIEKIMNKYYMLLESLEFRMERHEQLSKLAQKAAQLTSIDQENRNINMKK